MNWPTKQHTLIYEKVEEKQRLSKEEASFLVHHPDNAALIQLANRARELAVGDTVYYTNTLFLYPTNLCELSCQFCSFYAKPGWKSAWFFTPDQLVEKIKQVTHIEINEVHVVGGLWKECDLDYYQELFGKIKTLDPSIHIKALTAVEYDFLATLHGCSVSHIFEKMVEFGMGSLPGGGAEVLVEEVRKKISPQKITGEAYLNIHKTAHKLNIPSNVSMLYNSIESWEDLITHLEKVRQVQDETGGFRTFIPLKYHTDNNALGKRKKRLQAKEDAKVYAISRLMLDNLRNIKVLWNYLGVELGQQMLYAGGNDFASTATEEKVITMAGGVKVAMDESTMERLIKAAHKIPKKAHSGYEYHQDEIELLEVK